jgi:hypothetical protein|tara:strand:- start:2961 stop:3359 length:399 start_codon:yes stop_codon:yes gene_type:complete
MKATIEESIILLTNALMERHGHLKPAEINKQLHATIAEVLAENPELKEAGLTGWVIDKVANGLKWATNRKADYQYDALLKSKQFRSLAKNYNMSEKGWDKAARKLIKKDPKRLAKILAYDLRNRKASVLFKQ